ncbi:unnamed protein product [Mytilus edulis]|uniref:Uncharacterized protein n=1 Tax=Mytilus edulis TaxID=6550 RepID=A0A8S3QWH5_MYTED|nr:unnamed protein product [Mytilus edulis]
MVLFRILFQLLETRGFYERSVLRFIDRRLPEDISLDGFVADFEAGLWQALRQRFPRYAIQAVPSTGPKQYSEGARAWSADYYNQKDSVHLPETTDGTSLLAPRAHHRHVLAIRCQSTTGHSSRYELCVLHLDRQHHLRDTPLECIYVSHQNQQRRRRWHNPSKPTLQPEGHVPFYQMVTELLQRQVTSPFS